MREIKFRAWDKSFEQMVEWEELKFDKDPGDSHICFYEQKDGSDSFWNGGADYITMQYTELKDKNGTAIYEGDIIKREFEVYAQVYDEATFASVDVDVEDSGYFVGVVNYRPSEGFILNKCSKHDDSGKLLEKRSGVKIYASHAKVIDNIYENPELLEKEQSK